jgi:drug/metabolite transporter (DMT)-like permease
MAFVVIFWATVATAFKLALQSLTPFSLLFYASLSAWLFFLTIVLRRRQYRMQLRQWGKKHYQALLIGLINPAAFYLILFAGYDRLPAQIAMTLNFAWPISLTLLAIPLLGHKPQAITLLSLLIGFSGMALVASGGKASLVPSADAAGIIMIISSGILWGIAWLLNKRIALAAPVKLLLAFSAAALSLPLCLLVVPVPALPTLSETALIGYIACFEMGISFLLWNRALELSDNPGSIALFIFLIPFLSLLVLHMILGETILLSTFLGALLIVAGIALNNAFVERKKVG